MADITYGILDGEFKVLEGQHGFGQLNQGKYYGVSNLVDDEGQSASKTAIKEAKTAKIDR